MARVPYVEYEDAPDEVRALYDSAIRFSGRITNFHKLLGHVPWLYRWYLPLQVTGQRPGIGHLDGRTKSLAHIRTSVVNACEYCTTHTSQIGASMGLSAEEVRSIHDGSYADDERFSPRDVAVLDWVTAVAENTARRDQAAFAALERHLGPGEIVEVTVLVGARTLTNRIQEALWTDLEDETFPDDPGATVDEDPLRAHVEVLRRQLGDPDA